MREVATIAAGIVAAGILTLAMCGAAAAMIMALVALVAVQ